MAPYQASHCTSCSPLASRCQVPAKLQISQTSQSYPPAGTLAFWYDKAWLLQPLLVSLFPNASSVCLWMAHSEYTWLTKVPLIFIWPVLDVHLPRTLGQGISSLMNEANRRLFKQIHVQLPIDHSLSLWLQENTKDRRIILKLNKLWVVPYHLSFF